MPIDRSKIQRGMRLEGGSFPADDVRRDKIQKGKFMTIDAQQPPHRHAASIRQPVNEPELDFLQKQSAAVTEIARRLELVRQQLLKVKY